ncbi:MAG: 50S ribosomal protein L19e [Candidatus Aenigmarchaeota archaeon]|nr:50S ribosomal protein L19e [Candidatus Aenigmarchaeota archaeon]MDW8149776.1 50S ribosomal protein L19e [Candidatus Aenigmarchaeota archaeon]
MSSFQKKLASKIFKVGIDKIFIESSKLKEVEKAVTRKDIKNLIKKGYIKKKIGKIKFPYKKRIKRVKKGSSVDKKTIWVRNVRALRKYLKELAESGKIEKKDYKKVYKWIKGGMFRSRAHMRIFLEQRGIIKNVEEEKRI